MNALLTDLYELNMVASYLRRGMDGTATFSLFVTVLGGLTFLVLIYRVLINVPGPNGFVTRDVGGFIGLLLRYLSRREGLGCQVNNVRIVSIIP